LPPRHPCGSLAEAQVSKTISIVAAVYDLRDLRNTDTADAINEMVDILTTGRIVPDALIDGARIRPDPRWWHLASLRLPLAEATLTVIEPPKGTRDPGRARTVCAIKFNRSEWDRLLARLVKQSPSPAMDERRTAAPSGSVLSEDRAPVQAPSAVRKNRAERKQFVKSFIKTEMHPTQAGLGKHWKDTGHKGQREEIRAEFREQMGTRAPTRGRPRKS
jgi:hypothetical protein